MKNKELADKLEQIRLTVISYIEDNMRDVKDKVILKTNEGKSLECCLFEGDVTSIQVGNEDIDFFINKTINDHGFGHFSTEKYGIDFSNIGDKEKEPTIKPFRKVLGIKSYLFADNIIDELMPLIDNFSQDIKTVSSSEAKISETNQSDLEHVEVSSLDFKHEQEVQEQVRKILGIKPSDEQVKQDIEDLEDNKIVETQEPVVIDMTKYDGMRIDEIRRGMDNTEETAQRLSSEEWNEIRHSLARTDVIPTKKYDGTHEIQNDDIIGEIPSHEYSEQDVIDLTGFSGKRIDKIRKDNANVTDAEVYDDEPHMRR